MQARITDQQFIGRRSRPGSLGGISCSWPLVGAGGMWRRRATSDGTLQPMLFDLVGTVQSSSCASEPRADRHDDHPAERDGEEGAEEAGVEEPPANPGQSEKLEGDHGDRDDECSPELW